MSETMDRFEKPRCLGVQYASQFHDESVASSYYGRPPYPEALLTALAALQPRGRGRVFELGCGTGDLTIGLAEHVAHIDAVEPSRAMLRIAAKRAGGDSSRISWHHVTAEAFVVEEPYDLVVAAQSLHWMDWAIVIPKIAAALAPGAFLAVAGRGRVLPTELGRGVGELIGEYSTNRDYVPYDAVGMLVERGLFDVVGRELFESSFSQSVDDYIEGIHSQNGFSRDRMRPEAAAEFDTAVRALAAPHADDGTLTLGIEGTLVWGRVAAGPS